MNCPCCQKIVSTDAQSCPHCGKNIQRYLRNSLLNAPHKKAITKAWDKIGISIFVLVIIMVFMIGLSAYFSMQSSLYHEISELAPEEYAAGVQRTANVFAAISVVGWLATLAVFFLLFLKTRKTVRKQKKIIEEEKALLLPE